MTMKPNGDIFYKDNYGTIYITNWETVGDIIDITTITKIPYVWGSEDQGYIENRVLYRYGIITVDRLAIKLLDDDYEIIAEGSSQYTDFFQVNFPCSDGPIDSFKYHLDSAVADACSYETRTWNPYDDLFGYDLLQYIPELEYNDATIGNYITVKDLARDGDRREPRQTRCWALDGVDDDFIKPTRITTGPINVLTCCAWVYPTASGTACTIIQERVGTTQRSWQWLLSTTVRPTLTYSTDGSALTNTGSVPTPLSINTWSHIAFVRNGSSVRFYINGVFDAEATITADPFYDATTPFTGGSGAPARNFKDIGVKQAALSDNDILAIYRREYDVSNFDAFYACEEEYGDIGLDSSGNGNHVTFRNASTFPGTGTFHVTSNILPFSRINEYGGSYGLAITSITSGAWSAWWLSSNTLVGDGYVEWVINSLTSTIVLGLSANSELPTTNAHNDIDIGFAYAGGTTITKYISGSTTVESVTLSVGDRMRFTRVGSTVTLYQNGVSTGVTWTLSGTIRAACALDSTSVIASIISFNGDVPQTYNSLNTNIIISPIQRNPQIPTQDIYGNTIHYIGPCPHDAIVEPTCFTGNGTNAYVDLGSSLLTNDFERLELLFKPTTSGTMALVSQGKSVPSSADFIAIIANYTGTAGSATNMSLRVRSSASDNLILQLGTGTLTIGGWHKVILTKNGTTFTLAVENFTTGEKRQSSGSVVYDIDTLTGSTTLGIKLAGTNFPLNGSISSFQLTSNDIIKYVPLQDGPGSGADNRDIAWWATDGTGDIINNAINNGTVSNIWANRCQYAKDYAVANGAYLDGNEVIIPVNPVTSLSVNDDTPNMAAKKHRSPYSRLNRNQYLAAELNGVVSDTAVEYQESVQDDSPVDSGFRRTRDDGDDRYFIAVTRVGYTATGLSSTDKTIAEWYVQ